MFLKFISSLFMFVWLGPRFVKLQKIHIECIRVKQMPSMKALFHVCLIWEVVRTNM